MAVKRYGSNIPFAREALLRVAADLRANGVAEYPDVIEEIVALYMHRVSPDKVTKPRHHAPSKSQAAKVRHLRATTDFSQQEIGQIVGLNAGRVSEIIHGMWP